MSSLGIVEQDEISERCVASQCHSKQQELTDCSLLWHDIRNYKKKTLYLSSMAMHSYLKKVKLVLLAGFIEK